MWAVGKAGTDSGSGDETDGSSRSSDRESRAAPPNAVEPSGEARRPFAAAQGANVVPFGSGPAARRRSSSADELDSPVIDAGNAAALVRAKQRRAAGSHDLPLTAPWEARLAKIFVLDEFEVGSRRLLSTAMAFDVLMSRVKHPKLVRAAVQFMQSVGLRRGEGTDRVRRSSILGLGAAIGFEQGGMASDEYAFAGRPDSALGLLGHGKYSDWIPLAKMKCKLGGREVDVMLRMRFRRTMFSADRAKKLRRERARAAAAGGLPLPPNAFTSTHSLTRFVFEVTDCDSGALVLKQHANYSEMLASQKTGVADLADDVIAAMEMAEGLVQVRQLEYLEHLERSAASQHEDGIRHVVPPSVIASRDDAARRIQEVVRRWRVRRRERSVAELVELLTASPHAREEMRVGLESMHCTTIRQWITGVNPFSSSTSMMRAITAKRRAMGAKGRLFIDPVTGHRRVRHPTRPREPFDVVPEAPSAQVTEDVLAFLEEQITMQALAGDSKQSRAGGAADERQKRSRRVRGFLRSAHAAEMGVGVAASARSGASPGSGPGNAARGRRFESPLARHRSRSTSSPEPAGGDPLRPRSRTRPSSPSAAAAVNKGRDPGRGLGAELKHKRTGGGAAAAFRPLAPASPSMAAARAGDQSVPLHERAAMADVSGPDGPETGVHASLRRDKVAAARTVEGMHDLVITSPRSGAEQSTRNARQPKRVQEDLGDMLVGPSTRSSRAVHARAGLLGDDEAAELRLPAGADPMQDLPSANPAHFMPIDPARLDQWVGFLADDDAFAALEKQWEFFRDHKRPDTPPPNMMEGKTIYDATPTVAPLPNFTAGEAETRSRRHVEGLTGQARDIHLRKRRMDSAIGGLALTLRATSEQTERAAEDMRLVRQRLSSAVTGSSSIRPSTAVTAALRAKTESMGTVLAYNETIRRHAEEDNLDVVRSGFNLESSLSAGGAMVRELDAANSAFARADRLGMAETIEIARRVRQAKGVVDTMRMTGELDLAEYADRENPGSEIRRPQTVGMRASQYSGSHSGAKARPRTSLAHAAGTLLYPTAEVAAMQASAPRSIGGVKVDGVDTMGYSGSWASGRTRRNEGGRWIGGRRSLAGPSQ